MIVGPSSHEQEGRRLSLQVHEWLRWSSVGVKRSPVGSGDGLCAWPSNQGARGLIIVTAERERANLSYWEDPNGIEFQQPRQYGHSVDHSYMAA